MSLSNTFFSIPIPVLMVLSIGLLFLIAWPITMLFTNRERREFQRIATQHGFVYSEENDPTVLSRSKQLTLSLLDLSQDPHPTVFPVLSRKEQSSTMWVYQYLYTGYDYSITSFSRTAPQKRLVALFETNDMRVPSFRLESRRWWDRVGSGYQAFRDAYVPMDIKDDQKFSEQFHLRGQNIEKVHALFDASVRNFFLRFPRKSFIVEGNGQWLAVYPNSDRGVSVRHLAQFIHDAEEIYAIFSREHGKI